MTNIVRIIILLVISFTIIGIPYVLNNWILINFTCYFIVCAFSILISFALQYLVNKGDKYKRTTLIIPWLITTIASFLVTINYINPKDSKIYSNADVNVLALKGVDVRDSIVLIGEDKKSSLYDNEKHEGKVCILPEESSYCKLIANVQDQPLYKSSSRFRHDKLLNSQSLPTFSRTLELVDSIKCTITLNEVYIKKLFSSIDSMNVSICFEHQSHKSVYQSAFNKRIKDSYSLYDVIHKNISFTPQEEDVINRLKNILIIRNREYSKDIKDCKKFFITYNHELEGIALICDGVNFESNKEQIEEVLAPEDYIYVGQYTTNTRPMSFVVDKDGYIEARYKFPYLYNFPRSSTEDGFVNGSRKILAISTSSERILQSDVDEAFYCDLFCNEKNLFGFSGAINYKVSTCDTPFTPSIIDDHKRDNYATNTLLAHNGSIWHIGIYDLRKNSPVTGKTTLFVNTSFIFLIIAVCCLFAFLMTQLCFNDSYKAGAIFSIWLFLIPIFVFRIYLLWRIAVFPPVSDITFNVFQRYRMENEWFDNAMVNTLIALFGFIVFTLLSIRFEKKIILSVKWGSKKVFNSFTTHQMVCLICWGTSILMSIASSGVFANIFAPVVSFFICEYIALKSLGYRWRVANIIIVTALLCKGDPGYAIMYIIFICVYFIIHLYAYLKSTHVISSNKAFAYLIWITLFILLGATIIFSPQLVAFAYDDTTPVIFNSITPSKLLFFALAIFICCMLSIYFWIKAKKSLTFISLALIPILACAFFFAGNYILEHEKHFKYRSLVHIEQVSEIMSREDIDNRNSTRVLEASQNQWFIQYQNNRGAKRITEDGIFSLSPHFKKGVSWNTQISDVIISRYVVGEISSLLPAAIVFLAICFLIFIFAAKNVSVAGKSIGYAVALLIAIQMTFVWMAATNRMIFFGQDFPFLSQNARITMFMFVFLLGFAMLLTNPMKKEAEHSAALEKGLTTFAHKRIPLFVTSFLAIFLFVGLFGNRYSDLYNEEDGGDSNDASEYNLSRMMSRCQADLSLINAYLAGSNIKVRPALIDGEPLTTLMDSLDNERGEGSLTHRVQELYDKKEISKFTLSMYNAYRNNLKRRNSISNIIHLKLNSSRTHYEFALNNGFYSLRNPDFDAMAWKNNIYSENVYRNSSEFTRINKNGYVIYGVPTSWIPKGRELGIVDATMVNSSTINQIRILHTEQSDYDVSLPIYPIIAGDVLEVSSNDMRKKESYRYGLSQEDVLVKNMIINGKRKFFYPLKEKCFWLKDFSDLASYCYNNNEDSLVITLDKQLAINIYNTLAETKKVCSVIALDGQGNVRVISDYKGDRYMLNPNNEEDIYERVKYSYLNPNPTEDINFFGNLNLCLLNPGPGSSLKPITYAAVTSQSFDFPWDRLQLMNPSPEYYQNTDSIKKIQDKKGVWRTFLYKYGPTYKYRKPFQSIYGDEDGAFGFNEQTWVNNVFYLAQSSNYYNAMITYLGHFSALDGNLNSSPLFRKANSSDYPKFTTDGGNSVFTFRISPKEENSRNNLLLNGLWSNFSIPTYLSYVDTLRYDFTGTYFNKVKKIEGHKLASIFPWVYPQNSRILDYLLDELSPAERLRQYTLGSYPLSITPLKMAEMYGKLYSLHPDFHATIIPNSIPFHEKWRGQDGDVKSTEEVFSFYQKNLFSGMRECVKQGTAKKHLKGLPVEYSYYAKTGTLLGTGASLDDRMLVVVITNKPIESVSNPSELRFYVVYFRFKQSGDMKNVNKVLEQIISSKSFNNYMR